MTVSIQKKHEIEQTRQIVESSLHGDVFLVALSWLSATLGSLGEPPWDLPSQYPKAPEVTADIKTEISMDRSTNES